MQALVSIHDVMPHTLKRVDRILDWLKTQRVPPVTLLVVPGRPWQADQIAHLRGLADAGHELAAHGWQHQTRPRRLSHRLHAALISRKVAEHLDLDSAGILELMQRSRHWFGENGLPLPDFYVPPAWALGPIGQSDLTQVPYRMIETTRGLLHREHARPDKPSAPLTPDQAERSLKRRATKPPTPEQAAAKQGPIQPRPEDETKEIVANDAAQISGRFYWQTLPLTGYEADTAFREFFLRRWNRRQIRAAQRKNLPLRISLHPDDLELRVADQIAEHIDAAKEFLSYSDYKPVNW